MSGGFNPVVLNLLVPPLGPNGPIALLRALEALLPTAELAWLVDVTGPETASHTRLPDRDGWLRAQLASGETVQVFTGPGQPPANVTFIAGLATARDGSQVGSVRVWLDEQVLVDDRVEEFLVASGDALGARYGLFTPLESSSFLLEIMVARPPLTSTTAALVQANPALATLPRLSPPSASLPVAWLPRSIDWLNYWSREAAESVGLDPQAPPAGARPLARGAWLWRLTPEPLDIHRPDHVAVLADAYRRFPRVIAR